MPATKYSWLVHVSEISLYLAAYLAYRLTKDLIFGESVALNNAEGLIRLEESLHIYVEPTLQAWSVENNSNLLLLFNWVYIVTYWPIILGMALVVYLVRREIYYYYRNVMYLNLAVSLVIFVVLPVAPPFKSVPMIIDSIQVFGPTFYGSPEMAGFYNTNAALPSLHFSWTAVMGVLFFRSLPGPAKALGFIYPALTLAAIIFTGNHFILDAVVGGLLVALCFGLMALARRLGVTLPQELVPTGQRPIPNRLPLDDV